jgi:hypothetical protein
MAAVGRNAALLGVGPGRNAGIGDTVAHGHLDHPRADGLNHPGGLHARRCRQCRQGIEAGAMVDVNVVQADGLVAHEGFAGAGCAGVNLFPAQHLGSAVLMDADGFGHKSVLLSLSNYFHQRRLAAVASNSP